jgi:hypothetical protein
MNQELKDNETQTPEEELPKWGWSDTEETPPPKPRADKRAVYAAEGFLKRAIRRVKLTIRRLHQFVREEQAYNFPESDSLLVQLILLLWNMLPVVASVVKEKLWKGQKQLFHRTGTLMKRVKRRKIHPAGFMVSACAVAAIILLCSTYTLGTTVR